MKHYINVVCYVSLRGNSYIPRPENLKGPKKGLINIRNEDNQCSPWCHIHHLNPREKNQKKEYQLKTEYLLKS